MGYVKYDGQVLYVSDIDYARGSLQVSTVHGKVFTLCSQEYTVHSTVQRAHRHLAQSTAI
jgi:hypothetical protein